MAKTDQAAGGSVSRYKVRIVASNWYFKLVEAADPEAAAAAAFGEAALDLSSWQHEGQGDADFYETIKEEQTA